MTLVSHRATMLRVTRSFNSRNANALVALFAETVAMKAIQDVIQRGNTAQVQAVTLHDPRLLADTSVTPYSQQLIRINQGLIDSGAQVIELVDLEWGPIAINGVNASATTPARRFWKTSLPRRRGSLRTLKPNCAVPKRCLVRPERLMRLSSAWRVTAKISRS